MVLELFKFIGFFLYFWIFRIFEAKNQLRRKRFGLKESFARSNIEDWKIESLGRKNERLIFQGSTENGDFILISVNFEKQGKAIGRVLLKVKGETFTSNEVEGEAVRDENGLCKILILGPIRLELREPFRRWRVTIRGTLSDSSGKQYFIRLYSWLSPTSDESYFLADLSLYQLTRLAVTNFHAACRLQTRQDFIQWGVLRAKILIDENEPYFIDFRTLRMKTLSPKNEDEIVANEIFSSYLEMGDKVFMAKLGFPESSKIAKIGELFQADHMRFKIYGFNADYSEFDIDKKELFLEPIKGSDFAHTNWPELSLSAKKVKFSRNNTLGFAIRLQSIQDLRMSMSFSISEPVDIPVTRKLQNYEASEAEKQFLILPLTHRACQDAEIAGGKGSNLAKLMSLQATFTVPNGFVVTVGAFEKHLRSNPALSKLIYNLTHELKPSSSKSAVEKFEKQLTDAFLQTSISAELDQALSNNLTRIFGARKTSENANDDDDLFAVRSSAIGEDGSEVSSAGQLETYLNTPKVEIRRKIIECWASNYRREILNYRLQNAQPLNSAVAVVIQKMINGSDAGVMFTNDPVKGDPSKIVINVVEGLGEALVSGLKTPEQIIVGRDLKVLNKSENCKLDDKISSELAHLGLLFEDAFSGPQDVEFAIKNGHVYILQARSITNLDLETDWEFEHEFDTPSLCEKDLHSTANVGEVLPRPMTPLRDSLLLDLYDRGLFEMLASNNYTRFPFYRRVRTTFLTYRQRTFINISEIYLPNWSSIEKDRTSEYSVAGQKMFTEKDIILGKLRFGKDHERSEGYAMYKMLKVMFYNSKFVTKDVEKSIEKIKKLEAKDIDDIDEQLQHVEQFLLLFFDVLLSHELISMFSSFTYVLVAMFIRGSAEGDLSPEVLSDIATLYSKNPLKPISADVPKALKRLAKTIVENNHFERFEKIEDSKKAFEFLMAQNDSTGAEASRFMELHGHRGVNELLLQGVAWKDDPTQIVKNLKSIIQHKDFDYQEVEEEMSKDDVIDQLKCIQPEGFKRKIFKFLIGEAYRGVFLREQIKSEVVYATGALRNQCLKLGEMLQNEGLLFEPRSILYATWEEINELTQIQNSRILHRIRRREKIFEKQVEQEYSLISEGTPIPRNLDKFKDIQSDIELSGTPVCEGIVSGIARVAKTLDEASQTQPGEILITRYTDIGWSPIFPIIRGLVTEIGGLLSHGSVVAREYGLPCIIAVDDATDIFHT
uniref:Phosphoenolpyruvate synthase n=1 Tax=Panagrolaimus sp. ES5 TaxID=591445 RepID=A0AC34FGA9_9BILA